MSEQDPKIIVDDDWKSQVEKEKEELQKQMEEQSGGDDNQFPEPSFVMLVSSLATQAVAALGQIPHPVSHQVEVDKPLAKHLIDTLAMLEQRTQGNLDSDEAALLENTLHQLRMAFVATPDDAASTDAANNPAAAPNQESSIELP